MRLTLVNRWNVLILPSAVASFAFALSTGCTTANPARSGPGFKYYVTGSPADVVKPTRELWVAQGGGDDIPENFVRMGEFAGGGDFVVLRASGADDYNDYIFGHCRCDSVETIVLDGGAATADPFVIRTIRNAEAIRIESRWGLPSAWAAATSSPAVATAAGPLR